MSCLQFVCLNLPAVLESRILEGLDQVILDRLVWPLNRGSVAVLESRILEGLDQDILDRLVWPLNRGNVAELEPGQKMWVYLLDF